MNEVDAHPYNTTEAILAYCLYLAGIPFLDNRSPCFNLYDEEILSSMGYKGQPLLESARDAWNQKRKGYVGYQFQITQQLTPLVKAYRDQCSKIEKGNSRASEMNFELLSRFKKGAISPAEFIVRSNCVSLKTRREFVFLWEKQVPVLRIPRKGKSKTFDTTTQRQVGKGRTQTVEGKGVSRPGFDLVSLNLPDEKLKSMGLL